MNEDGSYNGSFILVKDTNSDTGGSPFGFDKIKFVSDTKNVIAESITKTGTNITDNLTFTNIDKINDVYQDINIAQENSVVSSADPSKILLKLYPVTKVSNVLNATTGEIYKVDDSRNRQS